MLLPCLANRVKNITLTPGWNAAWLAWASGSTRFWPVCGSTVASCQFGSVENHSVA